MGETSESHINGIRLSQIDGTPQDVRRPVYVRQESRLLKLGLRVSEAVGADIEDLGEQGRHRVLKLKGKGQTTKAAVAPLNAAVAHAVDRTKGARTKGPLLITSTGERLTRQHAGKVIKRMGEQIGIPDLHPHALRHGFVTLSLDEGASLRDVQDGARGTPRLWRGSAPRPCWCAAATISWPSERALWTRDRSLLFG